MRILLRRAKRGFRLVRGGHVINLQNALVQARFSAGSVDGIYGNATSNAVRAWQLATGQEPTGDVNALAWQGITRSEPPSVFSRCVALTAAFEGHGYTKACGNWDNAYLTWGTIGFTLRHGSLGKIIERIAARHPGLLEQTIGEDKASELRNIIDAKKTEQRDWANAISRPPSKYRLRQDWEDAFEKLGFRAEVRAIQEEVARDIYWQIAIRDFKRFKLESELDIALCFDTAVQNGGINETKTKLVQKGLKKAPKAKAEARRKILADGIADGSSERFREDVRTRRMAIATGNGIVHGSTYLAEDWGLDEVSVDPLELL